MENYFNKWTEQLLDITKRNKLINFKPSKNFSVEILSPKMATVYGYLQKGSAVSFFDVDALIKERSNNNNGNNNNDKNSNNNSRELDKDSAVNLSVSEIIASFENKKDTVLAYKKGVQLSNIFTNLKKLNKSSFVEKGFNILFVAFGMLRYKDKDGFVTAPLMLLPITIEEPSKNRFYIKLYDDELVINPALKIKLKLDFNINLPLLEQEIDPEDKGKSKVILYYEFIKEWIKSEQVSMAEFKLQDEMHISAFSFHKLDMYNDLILNKEQILSSPNIINLINPSNNVANGNGHEFNSEEFFKNSGYMDMVSVADCDSSQLEAIAYAKTGHNMVLQGPPGTGKSQTITNMIAEFLNMGKKVLFVSEKLAALKVVKENLARAKLDDFLLELHSNKINKKEVIANLYNTLVLDKVQTKKSVNQELEELNDAKLKLDEYANIMHTKQDIIGMTPYELIGLISSINPVDNFFYDIKDKINLGNTHVNNAVDTLQEYVELTNTIGIDYKSHPWYGYVKDSSEYGDSFKLKQLLYACLDFINQSIASIAQLNLKYNTNINNNIESIYNLELFRVVKELRFFSGAFFDKSKLRQLIDTANQEIALELSFKSLEQEVLSVFDQAIFSLDLEVLNDKLQTKYRGLFKGLKRGYKKDIATIKACLKHNKLSLKEIRKYVYSAKSRNDVLQAIHNNKAEFYNLVGFIQEWDFNAALQDLIALDKVLKKDNEYFINLDINQFISIQYDLKVHLDNHERLITDMSINTLQELFNIDILNFNKLDLTSVLEKINIYIDNFDKASQYQRLNRVFKRLYELQIQDFIEKIVNEKIGTDCIVDIYKYSFYTQHWLKVVNNNPVLKNFELTTHTRAVEVFRAKDKLLAKINQAKINAKLSQARPNVLLTAASGQVAILKREATKKTRQMPVRTLLSNCAQLVSVLKPCFLMSPLSVASFLDSQKIDFDVVIFDEASQIFVWDAIGAIYRAKQVIVVGDNMQMPPSNFFNAELTDEDEELDDALDFESILDICSSSFLEKRLLWHYRSRVESLIAFSNNNFYDAKLITFDSNRFGADLGVEFYYTQDGVFDRKSKDNIIEANKVVDLIYEHFTNNPNRSLGVVAFSMTQQKAIEMQLESRRRQDDQFDNLFEREREQFFIKNLETVQGDERDTIIFSVGYAKDINGKFIHNFGPINREGGHRRLNVAITRAKYNVKVVSSITGNDIDLNRTSARGSKMLREYLDYAQYGDIALENATRANDVLDNGLLVQVYDTLINAGYEVKTNLGHSSYKIDFVIKHPLKDSFVLAVECDGLTYNSAKTTRDRDRLRQDVLERLGWKFYRIWSYEWFFNTEEQKNKLLQAVDTAIQEFDVEKVQEAENDDFMAPLTDREKALREMFSEYVEVDVMGMNRSRRGYEWTDLITDVVKIEQPITEQLLLQRVSPVFGRVNVSAVVVKEFKYQMTHNKDCHKVDDYYTTDLDASIEFRVPKPNKSRNIQLMCNAEISDGLMQIIRLNVGIKRQELFLIIARLLGYAKLGSNISGVLEKATDNLIENNIISEVGEVLYLV